MSNRLQGSIITNIPRTFTTVRKHSFSAPTPRVWFNSLPIGMEGNDISISTVASEMVVGDRELLDKKIAAIRSTGHQKLQVIADFDRTLTKYSINGQLGSSSHGLLRQENPEFDAKRRQLFEYYHPLEFSPTIPIEEKTRLMEEWWGKTHALLIEGGLTYDAIKQSVANASIAFREGVAELFEFLEERDIPVLIFSAGLADIIEEVLRQKLHRSFKNVKIVSNRMIFDSDGRLVSFKGKTIHSLNKNEHALDMAAPLHDRLGDINGSTDDNASVKRRTNVLLLGDHIGDLGMSDGLNYETRISVGFLNDHIEKSLSSYSKAFDVVYLALRLMKYAVGKSGVEFRREMQRHSAAVRPLFHYKGHPDPLKGDALNKAVRDTAHETIAAIFAGENDKPSPAEDLNKRIQGFGNTNYEMPSEEKKSFLSEVVGIGSASIKQGLSTFAQGHLSKKNENASYKSPTTLRRSLTIESEHGDRYEPVDYRNETQGSFGISKNVSSGSWSQDSRVTKTEITNGESGRSYRESKTREERLLETIVTSGGVRLQPTRDAIQVFLVEAAKLDALALSYALESKLQSPQWQVRMKAICVLESLLRKKDDEHFSTVESYFSENKDVVVRCSESPQASLKEKANKVLYLLSGEQAGSAATYTEKTKKADTTTVVPMPDLIDTGDADAYQENFTNSQSDQNITNLSTPPPLIDDLFGDGPGTGVSASESKNDDDPFADVSFHASDSVEHADDLFSGMIVDDKQSANENHMAEKKNGPELFDIFGSNHELPQEQETHKKDLNDLMDGLSINENTSNMKQKGTSPVGFPQSLFSDSNSHPSHQVPNDALSGMFNSQTAMTNANVMFPPGAMPYNISPGLMMNPTFSSQPLNYAAMGSLLAQQQLLATMSNLQHLGNMNTQNAGVSHVGGTNGAYVPPLPDIFQSNFPTQQATSTMMNSSKKEETRAFDFISDHLNAARDPKRVV